MPSGDRSGFVYVIQNDSGLCKIGRAKDVGKRIRSLSTGSSSELKLIAAWPCDDAAQHESRLHAEWNEHRVRGEWFRIPEDTVTRWQAETGAHVTATATATAERRQETRWRGDEPGDDGAWWMASKTQAIDCPQCGRKTQDAPAVMKYVQAADHRGIQARANPEWPRLGWVVWRQCEHCSWMDFRTEHRTLAEIKQWKVGPWRPTS